MKAMLRVVRSVWTTSVLERANRLMAAGQLNEAFRALRRLSVGEFGELLRVVPDRFAALRAALPEMPAEEIQRDWCGNSGRVLLAQTCAFVRSVETAFLKLTGRPLENAIILDYGCGWGRIMRLMYRFSAPEKIYGLDPWDASLEMCRATRMPVGSDRAAG